MEFGSKIFAFLIVASFIASPAQAIVCDPNIVANGTNESNATAATSITVNNVGEYEWSDATGEWYLVDTWYDASAPYEALGQSDVLLSISEFGSVSSSGALGINAHSIEINSSSKDVEIEYDSTPEAAGCDDEPIPTLPTNVVTGTHLVSLRGGTR